MSDETLRLTALPTRVLRTVGPVWLVGAFAIWRIGLTADHHLNGWGWFMVGVIAYSMTMVGVRIVRPTVLILGPEGLSFLSSSNKRQKIAWRDLDKAWIVPPGRIPARRLGLDFLPGRGPMPKLSEFNRAIYGYDTSIGGDIWNMPLEDLLKIFQQRIAASRGA
jgi:hypothetical protein